MKRKAVLGLITAFLIGAAACGNADVPDSGAAVDESSTVQQQTQTVSDNTQQTGTVSDSTQETGTVSDNTQQTGTVSDSTQETESSADLTFTDLSKYQFEFCSGAGGWSTDFTIEPDGSFGGAYHDFDLGITGDGYENGTVYISEFEGHFKDLTKVNNHCYRMTLADISYQENDFGREEITDGYKYIYSDAYGLTGTDTFLVYTEGTPVSEISEEAYSWLALANQSDTELTMTAIVNEGQQEGIYSMERMTPFEDAQAEYESCKSSYEYWADQIDKAESQIEINDNARKRFEETDECLNYIWKLVKAHTDETKFQDILEEQRSWISEKEEKAKEASAEYGPGSLATAVYYDELAEQTMSRCEELIEYLR